MHDVQYAQICSDDLYISYSSPEQQILTVVRVLGLRFMMCGCSDGVYAVDPLFIEEVLNVSTSCSYCGYAVCILT